MSAEPRVLICGSMAFDTICVFPGRFAEHIVTGATHKISVSFLVENMRREFGGCAGNIAYTLKLLGGAPVICAAIGDDGADYRERMAGIGIGLDALRAVPGSFTANCHITTDLDDNQITAFHPGAMNFAHEASVPVDRGIRIGIVAPDGREAMTGHAAQFAAAGIPFLFDPGQGLPMFHGPELLQFIDQATWVAVNDYEDQLLRERTGLSPEAIAKHVRAYIVTRGVHGSYVYTDGERLVIPTVPAEQVVDPTGCGDAYRAGVIFGLQHGFDWQTTGRIASLMGTIKISAMVFLIIANASAFGQILAYTGTSAKIVAFVTETGLSPQLVLIGMMLTAILLGTFLDELALLMISIPIYMPIVKALAFDPVWFGLLMLITIEVATISPPYGLALFVLKGVVPDATMADVWRASIPYMFISIFAMALIFVFPGIATWLPALMR